MKVFSRTYLPESINYNKRVYTRERAGNSEFVLKHNRHPEGKRFVFMEVLHRNLKGVTNFHGKPYKPTWHVFVSD